MPLYGSGGVGGFGGGGGIPPHDLTTFTSQSTEEGILLSFSGPEPTYLQDGDGQPVFAAAPRGIMIRYSADGYPLKETDGVFGYNYNPEGEDWDGSGTHTCTIVGLTKDTKYYFTAFPYSDYGVYNRSESAKNRTEMTWVGNKGTISVNVQPPAGYLGTIGQYTITLVDQDASSPQNIEKTVTGAGVTQFGGLVAGKSYKVRLSSTGDLKAPPDSEVIDVVAGVNKDVTMTYSYAMGTVRINISTNPTGMPIGSYTINLVPQAGGSTLSQTGSGTQTLTFNNVPVGTYTVSGTTKNHYAFNAGAISVTGGNTVTGSAKYTFNASFAESTWSEIQAVASSGQADSFFNIGDTKSGVTVGTITGEWSTDGPDGDTTDTIEYGTTSMSVVLVGINADAARSLTCCTLGYPMEVFTNFYGINDNVHGWGYSRPSMLVAHSVYAAKILPQIRNYLKEVTVRSKAYRGTSQSEVMIDVTTDSIFVPSATNLGNDIGEGVQYPYFSTNTRRKLSGSVIYGTRSRSGWNTIYGVNSDGSFNSNLNPGDNMTSNYGGNYTIKYPLCFVVG